VNTSAVIQVQNVSKAYTIWSSPAARLHGPLLGQIGQLPFLPSATRKLCKRLSHEAFKYFFALRGVSFEVKRGESIGVIGLNGSGKSTLLQIIAGTLQPTEGSVDVTGRVAALLELGSGFNLEFTGRENVFLNASILGVPSREIEARFQKIAEFADIGEFIEHPVKTYSSGMVVRLAFAVLTQVEPDILIIDEALSVGDFLFQQKCYDCLREFQRRGCTFLFVSHSMATVLDLCDRALLLENGLLTFDGLPKEAVDLYEAHSLRTRFGIGCAKPAVTHAAPSPLPTVPLATAQAGPTEPATTTEATLSAVNAPPAEPSILTDAVSLDELLFLDENGTDREFVTSGQMIRVVISVRFHRSLRDPHIGFKIRNTLGVVLYETNTYCMRHFAGPVNAGDVLVAEFNMGLPLNQGDYSVTACVANEGRNAGDFIEALLFQHDARHFGVTRDWRRHDWSGLFNLEPSVAIRRKCPSSPALV
jgi:lipopolysaccharide transport system ATP-binding protein